MSYNKISLIGNLGRDVELRYTPQGVAVATFSMAHSYKKKGKEGELNETTQWFKVTAWRAQAENAAKYLSKGNQVYVEGRLEVEEWTDKENNNRYTLSVQATEIQFLTNPNGERGSVDKSMDQTPNHAPEDEDQTPSHSGPVAQRDIGKGALPSDSDDDIPF